jgi:DNA-binding response OmpR family regulator/DNA-binding CsgD family transcriptional regulator
MRETDKREREIVLVVDDSPETLSFLTTALKEMGLTVLVAIDGDGALAVVERVTPGIILMDAVMPGLDGFEACRRLKGLPDIAHVPVIFMTGLSDTEHIVRGLDAGGVDYVTKPIVVDELAARIRVHLVNARLAQSARLALDTAGRFLLAITSAGVVRWSTPQAARLLALSFATEGDEAVASQLRLPKAITLWLAQRDEETRAGAAAGFVLTSGERRLNLSYLGKIGPDKYLVRLSEADAPDDDQLLRESLNLTGREAEVLAWIARGKSSRNISEILGISTRTVDKHLEQIYSKLGVENRVSAAALAVRILGSRA